MIETCKRVLGEEHTDTLTSVNVRVTYPTNADGTPHPGKHAWVMFHHAVHSPSVIYDKYDGTWYWCVETQIGFGPDGAPGAMHWWPSVYVRVGKCNLTT